MIFKYNFNLPFNEHLTMKKEIINLDIRALEKKKIFY